MNFPVPYGARQNSDDIQLVVEIRGIAEKSQDTELPSSSPFVSSSSTSPVSSPCAFCQVILGNLATQNNTKLTTVSGWGAPSEYSRASQIFHLPSRCIFYHSSTCATVTTSHFDARPFAFIDEVIVTPCGILLVEIQQEPTAWVRHTFEYLPKKSSRRPLSAFPTTAFVGIAASTGGRS
ncbi:hypothetical protein E4U33_001206 [Claviceps sp. LM78 group G4]|nr:hypothetical protein E4U33_001206 [Claviceps sp. LM78 group G4]